MVFVFDQACTCCPAAAAAAACARRHSALCAASGRGRRPRCSSAPQGSRRSDAGHGCRGSREPRRRAVGCLQARPGRRRWGSRCRQRCQRVCHQLPVPVCGCVLLHFPQRLPKRPASVGCQDRMAVLRGVSRQICQHRGCNNWETAVVVAAPLKQLHPGRDGACSRRCTAALQAAVSNLSQRCGTAVLRCRAGCCAAPGLCQRQDGARIRQCLLLGRAAQ